MQFHVVRGLTESECNRKLDYFVKMYPPKRDLIIEPPRLKKDNWLISVIKIDKPSERNWLSN